MGAMEAGDGADLFAGLGVDNHDLGAAGEVEAVGGGIDDQVVPAAIAADLPMVDDFVGLLRRRVMQGRPAGRTKAPRPQGDRVRRRKLNCVMHGRLRRELGGATRFAGERSVPQQH